MENNIIIESKTYKKKTFFAWIIAISLVLFSVFIIFPSLYTELGNIAINTEIYKDIKDKYEKGMRLLPDEENILESYSSAADYAWSYLVKGLTKDVATALTVGIAVLLLGIAAWAIISRTTLTVGETYIVRRTVFGRRTYIPLKALTAFGTNGYKGIYIASPSDKFNLLLVANRHEIIECISALTGNRTVSEKAYEETTDEE